MEGLLGYSEVKLGSPQIFKNNSADKLIKLFKLQSDYDLQTAYININGSTASFHFGGLLAASKASNEVNFKAYIYEYNSDIVKFYKDNNAVYVRLSSGALIMKILGSAQKAEESSVAVSSLTEVKF